MLTNETRCRPINCPNKERCERFTAPVNGNNIAHFDAGPNGCVGKFIPNGIKPKVESRVHESPTNDL